MILVIDVTRIPETLFSTRRYLSIKVIFFNIQYYTAPLLYYLIFVRPNFIIIFDTNILISQHRKQ